MPCAHPGGFVPICVAAAPGNIGNTRNVGNKGNIGNMGNIGFHLAGEGSASRPR